MKLQVGLILAAMLMGIVLLLSALFLDQIWLASFRRVVELPTSVPREIARDFTTFIIYPQGFPVIFERRVRIEAPGVMRIDESVGARFRYSEWEYARLREGISSDLRVTLAGANFDVKPQETQEVLPAKMNPVTLVWTVKPKDTGNHVITIDFSQLLKGEGTDSLYVVTNIAGKESPAPPEEAILEVPVMVLTEWGVPKWTVVLFKAMLAFVGFLLATPSVWRLVQSLRSRLSPPGANSQALKATGKNRWRLAFPAEHVHAVGRRDDAEPRRGLKGPGSTYSQT